MNRVLLLIATCVALVIVQTVFATVLVVLLCGLLFCSITRPRETIVFVLSLVLMGIANAHPIPLLVMLGVVGVGVSIAGGRRRPALIGLSYRQPDQH